MTNPPSTDSGEILSPQTRYQESDRSSESLSDKSNQQARKRSVDSKMIITSGNNSDTRNNTSDDSKHQTGLKRQCTKSCATTAARSDDERPISITAHPNSPDPEFDSDDSSYDGNGEMM
ncbi:hypothetical protein BASA62_000195 [Batrachochytrium salamandrivorans]|nr:hypothetical protein BASA62_000195 [Batrachochytrium salamandrivorans]